MAYFGSRKWRSTEKAALILTAELLLLGLLLRTLPGVRFSGTLCCVLAAVCAGMLCLCRLSHRDPIWKMSLRLAEGILAVLAVCLMLTEIWVVHEGETDQSAQAAEVVIVLGAGVNGKTPSVTLQTRINAAAEYLKAHSDIPAILSGGQGPGEEISEARAMYNALTALGIDAKRLILEESSTNTRENLENSMALLSEHSKKRVALVTNDFHMARACLLRTCDVGGVVRVPAELPWWLSANYYLRESFAMVKDLAVVLLERV